MHLDSVLIVVGLALAVVVGAIYAGLTAYFLRSGPKSE